MYINPIRDCGTGNIINRDVNCCFCQKKISVLSPNYTFKEILAFLISCNNNFCEMLTISGINIGSEPSQLRIWFNNINTQIKEFDDLNNTEYLNDNEIANYVSLWGQMAIPDIDDFSFFLIDELKNNYFVTKSGVEIYNSMPIVEFVIRGINFVMLNSNQENV